ncbi:MAG: hypothetical protein HKN20_05020, partial [Gemmatimonadetes bacterium]|nr:hypothetical protein [Gemmatimonadota bacterium]
MFVLGRSGDLRRSIDGGGNWILQGNAGASDCADLAVGRSGDLFVLTETGDLLRSIDNGSSWTAESNAGFSDGVALTVGGGSGFGDTLYAATSTGDIARIPPGGSWAVVGNTSFTPIVDLLWT